MPKRTGPSQDTSDRSAKRSKPIDISSASDSESDLPDLDFAPATRSTQKSRNASQANAATPRGSARRSRPVEAQAHGDGEQTPSGIGSTRDHVNSCHDTPNETRRRTPPHLKRPRFPTSSRPQATPQSSRHESASGTGDSRNHDGVAGPSDASNVIATQPGASHPSTGHSVRAIFVDNTGTVAAQPSSSRHSTVEQSEIAEDAITPTARQSQARRSSMGRPVDATSTNDTGCVVAEPTVVRPSTAGQLDGTEDVHTRAPQGHELHVENEQQHSEQSHVANDDLEDLMLIVEEMSTMPIKDLEMMWTALSENSPQRTAEDWKLLYNDQALPTYKARRLIALMNERKFQRSGLRNSDQGTHQPMQLVLPADNARQVERAGAKVTHASSPVVYRHGQQDGAQEGTHPTPAGAAQSQVPQLQHCIRGTLKFIDCVTVNVASSERELDGKSQLQGDQTHGPLASINSDLIFEGCKEVNILTPQALMTSTQIRQQLSCKADQAPAQPAQVHAKSQPPQAPQGQDPSQIMPQAPTMPQHPRPDMLPPPQAHGQPHLPAQIPAQRPSYGPPIPPQAYNQNPPQNYQGWPPAYAQSHAQMQAQPQHHAHPYDAAQTQVQIHHWPLQHAQQMAAGPQPQASSSMPQRAPEHRPTVNPDAVGHYYSGLRGSGKYGNTDDEDLLGEEDDLEGDDDLEDDDDLEEVDGSEESDQGY